MSPECLKLTSILRKSNKNHCIFSWFVDFLVIRIQLKRRLLRGSTDLREGGAVGETGEDWNIFHICCNSSGRAWDSFSEFRIKKGNYKYFNSSQTFCSYIRYRLSRKLSFGAIPILPNPKMSGRNGTLCGEEWEMYGKIKISNYLK